MTTTFWNRVQQSSPSYDVGWFGMDNVGEGSTIKRIRWSWGFAGVTADTVSIDTIMENYLIVGLVTTIGNGLETPPNPRDAAIDAAPPTQRWLWWEVRQPIVTAVDHAAGVITWRDSGAQEVPDVRTQVLATGIPGGEFLNLWFTWQAVTGAGWDASGAQHIWCVCSTLTNTP